MDGKQAAGMVAYLMVFGATVLGTQMIAMCLRRAATLIMLGPGDAMGGAILGAVKGFVIIELLLIAGITFPSLHVVEAIDKSSFAPFFLELVPVLKFLLPREFRQAIDNF